VSCELNEDPAAAQRAWSLALTTLEGLLQRDRENPKFRRMIATSLQALGTLLLDGNDLPGAAAKLTAAKDYYQKLVAEFPKDDRLRRQFEETLALLKETDDARKTAP
jgi:hypothetical protein